MAMPLRIFCKDKSQNIIEVKSMGGDIFLAAIIPIICGALVSCIVTRVRTHLVQRKKPTDTQHDDSDL